MRRFCSVVQSSGQNLGCSWQRETLGVLKVGGGRKRSLGALGELAILTLRPRYKGLGKWVEPASWLLPAKYTREWVEVIERPGKPDGRNALVRGQKMSLGGRRSSPVESFFSLCDVGRLLEKYFG